SRIRDRPGSRHRLSGGFVAGAPGGIEERQWQFGEDGTYAYVRSLAASRGPATVCSMDLLMLSVAASQSMSAYSRAGSSPLRAPVARAISMNLSVQSPLHMARRRSISSGVRARASTRSIFGSFTLSKGLTWILSNLNASLNAKTEPRRLLD